MANVVIGGTSYDIQLKKYKADPMNGNIPGCSAKQMMAHQGPHSSHKLFLFGAEELYKPV